MSRAAKLLNPRAYGPLYSGLRKEVDLRTAATRADRALKKACRPEGLLLVGPFISEIGFETLYWIPMLNWAKEHYGIDPARTIAMSRGGPHSWYGGLADRYVEVFDHASQDELKEWYIQRVADTRTQKQFGVSDFDRELVRRALPELGGEPTLLHPSLMYQLFRPFWARIRPAALVQGRTKYAPFPPQRPSEAASRAVADLPDDYVAVKLYFGGTLPQSEHNVEFLRDLIARLTRTTNVVILSTPVDVDDHADFDGGGEVHRIDPFMTPSNNLEVQTAVLRGAKALFTTYGGFAHLGPFLGVPTFAVHSPLKANPSHLDVMRRALQKLKANQMPVGGFILLHVDDLHLLELALGVALESSAG